MVFHVLQLLGETARPPTLAEAISSGEVLSFITASSRVRLLMKQSALTFGLRAH